MKSNLKKLSRDGLEDIARILRCLSDVTRLEILQALKDKELCVSDIVTELEAGQANISKHLQVLAQAHLVKSRKEGTSVYYSIFDQSIISICDTLCAYQESVLKQKMKALQT